MLLYGKTVSRVIRSVSPALISIHFMVTHHIGHDWTFLTSPFHDDKEKPQIPHLTNDFVLERRLPTRRVSPIYVHFPRLT
jgi:hypothetical protein